MPEVAVYTSNSRGVLETSKKLRVKITDELRELASEEEGSSPEPSVADTEFHRTHPAGETGEDSVPPQR